MSIWQNPADGTLHDDMDGAALNISTWPQGMTLLTDAEAAIAQAPPAPTMDQLAPQARAKRDALISGTSYLMEPDYPITADKLAELKVYRQALRDVPTQKGFPEVINWPEFTK